MPSVCSCLAQAVSTESPWKGLLVAGLWVGISLWNSRQGACSLPNQNPELELVFNLCGAMAVGMCGARRSLLVHLPQSSAVKDVNSECPSRVVGPSWVGSGCANPTPVSHSQEPLHRAAHGPGRPRELPAQQQLHQHGAEEHLELQGGHTHLPPRVHHPQPVGLQEHHREAAGAGQGVAGLRWQEGAGVAGSLCRVSPGSEGGVVACRTSSTPWRIA